MREKAGAGKRGWQLLQQLLGTISAAEAIDNGVMVGAGSSVLGMAHLLTECL